MIEMKDYEEAIKVMQAAMTQLQPDGRLCAICEDSDHQAWECRFNPVRALKRMERLENWAGQTHEQLHKIMGV